MFIEPILSSIQSSSSSRLYFNFVLITLVLSLNNSCIESSPSKVGNSALPEIVQQRKTNDSLVNQPTIVVEDSPSVTVLPQQVKPESKKIMEDITDIFSSCLSQRRLISPYIKDGTLRVLTVNSDSKKILSCQENSSPKIITSSEDKIIALKTDKNKLVWLEEKKTGVFYSQNNIYLKVKTLGVQNIETKTTLLKSTFQPILLFNKADTFIFSGDITDAGQPVGGTSSYRLDVPVSENIFVTKPIGSSSILEENGIPTNICWGVCIASKSASPQSSFRAWLGHEKGKRVFYTFNVDLPKSQTFIEKQIADEKDIVKIQLLKDGEPNEATLVNPSSLVVDKQRNTYFVDQVGEDYFVRKVSNSGDVSTLISAKGLSGFGYPNAPVKLVGEKKIDAILLNEDAGDILIFGERLHRYSLVSQQASPVLVDGKELRSFLKGRVIDLKLIGNELYIYEELSFNNDYKLWKFTLNKVA